MNYKKQLLSSLFIVLVLIGAASAQERVVTQEISLASMPAGERFVYEKGGFSIALPRKPTETSVVDRKDLRGMLFAWEFKEGRISIRSAQFSSGVTSATDRETLFKGYVAFFAKNDGFKLITETPFALGEFKGKTYSMLLVGQRAKLSVLFAGDKFLEIMAWAYDDVPNSDTLIFKAANSLSLLPAPAK